MTAHGAGAFKREIDAFLKFKRARGMRYEREEHLLRSFMRFLRGLGGRPSADAASVRGWLSRAPSRKPTTLRFEFSVMRQFCLFRRRRDARAFVPDRRQMHLPRLGLFIPHIPTAIDVLHVLKLAELLARPPFRGQLYRALILTLYCTGLRLGEALRLRMRDVDLNRAVLFIPASKGRSRWVPFHSSLKKVLQAYSKARLDYVSGLTDDDAFFIGHNRRRLRVKTASEVVRGLLRRAGLKPGSGRIGPRPYDLRHAFAVSRLTWWHRSGVDFGARIPWLSAYMGHDNIMGTERYLAATPALARLASDRLHAHLRGPRNPE